MRKGERATPVVYWKWRTPEELAQRAAQTGKEDVAPCTPFVSDVFNFEQVEDVARPAADLPPRPAGGVLLERHAQQRHQLRGQTKNVIRASGLEGKRAKR